MKASGIRDQAPGLAGGDAPNNSQFSTLNSQSPLPSSWDELLGHPFAGEPLRSTLAAAEAAAALETVFPPRGDWFAALELTPPERVRAVILGQDPYHGPGQAMGLAFSVPRGVQLPPSLRNIYKELESDLHCPAPEDGDLTFWAEQGVLLLNTVLTVAEGRANSHARLGWQRFTDELIGALARLPQPIAFVLWGAQAQQKAALAQPSAGPRLVLTAPHPSPLSAHRGFFGSKPFSQVNAFLRAQGEAEIRWA